MVDILIIRETEERVGEEIEEGRGGEEGREKGRVGERRETGM